jgi:hypothetical protein
MSNIGDYQALVAAFTVDFTSQFAEAISVACKDAVELKNGVRASGTPVRMLLPYGGGENMSAELLEPDDTFGPNVWIRWTFSDVFLLRHATLGEGLGDSAYDLREYVTAYMTAAYAMSPAVTSGDRMTVDTITVRVDEAINFPAGGQDFFIGAVATWTVTEDDPP